VILHNDGNPCTDDFCVDGECVYNDVICDDYNDCTDDCCIVAMKTLEIVIIPL